MRSKTMKKTKYNQNFNNNNDYDDDNDYRKFKKNNLRDKRREKENSKFSHFENNR